MYLTAQRVVCLKDGAQGINSYYYRHDRELGEGKSLSEALDESPGVLVNSNLQVPSTGNRVRSFLDIVGPNTWKSPEVLAAFQKFLEMPPERLPWVVWGANWIMRFHCESLFTACWDREAKLLFENISPVIPSAPA